MNLLIVDDERMLVKGLAASLRKEDFQVSAAYDGREALEILKRDKIDLIPMVAPTSPRYVYGIRV